MHQKRVSKCAIMERIIRAKRRLYLMIAMNADEEILISGYQWKAVKDLEKLQTSV